MLALFCRYGFASVFSFPEPTPGTGSLATTLSQTPDSRRSAGGWGRGIVSGRKSRAKSGQSGQFTLLWSFTYCLAHVSLLSLLGTGQLPVLEGSSFAFGFPARESHGLMTVRSRSCLFAFWCRDIISLFLMQFPGATQIWGGNSLATFGKTQGRRQAGHYRGFRQLGRMRGQAQGRHLRGFDGTGATWFG